MPKKIIYCNKCEAEFTIKHNMDEEYYEILYCPFCNNEIEKDSEDDLEYDCLLYTSPSPRDQVVSRMPSSA